MASSIGPMIMGLYNLQCTVSRSAIDLTSFLPLLRRSIVNLDYDFLIKLWLTLAWGVLLPRFSVFSPSFFDGGFNLLAVNFAKGFQCYDCYMVEPIQASSSAFSFPAAQAGIPFE